MAHPIVTRAEALHAEGRQQVAEVFSAYWHQAHELADLSSVAADLLAACESAVTAIGSREEPVPAEREALAQGLRALTKARAHMARYHGLTDTMIREGLRENG